MITAEAVLALHLSIIAFNLFGLIAVPVGAAFGWRFVHVLWWRLLHVVLLAAVAAQAVLGRACILTLWQAALAGGGAENAPLIARWVNRLIYWPFPIWVFAVLYLAVFGYALALFWLVPPNRGRPPEAAAAAATTSPLSSRERILIGAVHNGGRGVAERTAHPVDHLGGDRGL